MQNSKGMMLKYFQKIGIFSHFKIIWTANLYSQFSYEQEQLFGN